MFPHLSLTSYCLHPDVQESVYFFSLDCRHTLWKCLCIMIGLDDLEGLFQLKQFFDSHSCRETVYETFCQVIDKHKGPWFPEAVLWNIFSHWKPDFTKKENHLSLLMWWWIFLGNFQEPLRVPSSALMMQFSYTCNLLRFLFLIWMVGHQG